MRRAGLNDQFLIPPEIWLSIDIPQLLYDNSIFAGGFLLLYLTVSVIGSYISCFICMNPISEIPYRIFSGSLNQKRNGVWNIK